MSGWLLLTMPPSGSAMLMGLSRWRVLLTYTTFRGSSGLRDSSGLASLRHARKQPIFAQRDKPLVMAQQVCSECHAVQRGEVPSPNSRAPTFTELATAPGMTNTALSVALTTPHAGMPMFTFTNEERQDVIAYVLSLR
jgi:mono/diheme cytochrome c family protein